MTDREMRLRRRIDVLIDERDRARVEFAREREQRVKLVRELDRLRRSRTGTPGLSDARDLRISRDAWKKRAQDAERMLNAFHRNKRKRKTEAA